MKEEKQELRYRLAGVAGSEWSVATTPDEFMQNGVYEIKVINDKNTFNFPFSFTGNDVAKLIVSDSGTNGKQQTSRIVVQTITITPGGTNKSITYTRTRRSVNSAHQWSNWVEPEAASTANIYDGSVTLEKLSSDIRAILASPSRHLYLAAGAEYNDTGIDKNKTTLWGEKVIHKAGHYYLNGLGDITEEQMLKIYNRGYFNDNDIAALGYPGLKRANDIRTNLCRTGMWNATLNKYLCYTNNKIEILNLHVAINPSDSAAIILTQTENMFYNANLLRIILPTCVLLSDIWSPTCFTGCNSLVEVRITKLKSNISFADSAMLNKDSVLYMIQNSTATTAITITLHPEAYTRLANDADIVAALEAQPLVSLASV